jgi:hypothetical protein
LFATAVEAGRLIIDPRLVILTARLKARVSITNQTSAIGKNKNDNQDRCPLVEYRQARGEAHETS